MSSALSVFRHALIFGLAPVLLEVGLEGIPGRSVTREDRVEGGCECCPQCLFVLARRVDSDVPGVAQATCLSDRLTHVLGVRQ